MNHPMKCFLQNAWSRRTVPFLALITSLAIAGTARAEKLTVSLDAPGKPISPDLFGIFFEDLNYAADGGLYAELIQNRSFEYQVTEQPTWTSLSYWELTKRGGGDGNWAVEDARPVHANNPHYLVLDVKKAGEGVGLVNAGFDGIAVKAGETYDVSFFAHQIFMNQRWGANSGIEGKPMPVTVRLETKDGQMLCEASLEITGREWTKSTAALTPSHSDDNARFVLLAQKAGGIALDELSLFPRKTFHDRPNGLRADLAQVIADLHPKFIRFPGGCLAHGDGVNNFYRWKDSIGPIEQRRGQKNLWGYHQSVGLGYFEFFQFCEDIGAEPLPVLAAGVSCQNSDHTGEVGQQCLPMVDMAAYVQDILDLIEWANGPATSKWGAKRAEAGHPEPFHLKYLGIGNEDVISPGFKERFKMIFDAVKAKHPEITVVGTVGPYPDGKDFDEGWKFAGELQVPIVDEHYYKSPEWFLQNLNRYDSYNRSHSKVYAGEYAAHDTGRKNTLRSALAEAAYMTQLERNGDVVHMASYAPLLSKLGRSQWTPDLIYFTNTKVAPSINYYVQQLFGMNSGDTYVSTQSQDSDGTNHIVFSAVRETKSGDLILKFVNNAAVAASLTINLAGAKDLNPNASKTVLAGDPSAVNTENSAKPTLPETASITVGNSFDYEAPASSLTVIRIKTGGENHLAKMQ
jgi:alpha-L-arabinofuranosidase